MGEQGGRDSGIQTVVRKFTQFNSRMMLFSRKFFTFLNRKIEKNDNKKLGKKLKNRKKKER